MLLLSNEFPIKITYSKFIYDLLTFWYTKNRRLLNVPNQLSVSKNCAKISIANSNFAQFVKNLIWWVHLKVKNVIENFKVSNSQMNLLYY